MNSCEDKTYKFCIVTGKLDGILPPIWLLLRSLKQDKLQKINESVHPTYQKEIVSSNISENVIVLL